MLNIKSFTALHYEYRLIRKISFYGFHFIFNSITSILGLRNTPVCLFIYLFFGSGKKHRICINIEMDKLNINDCNHQCVYEIQLVFSCGGDFMPEFDMHTEDMRVFSVFKAMIITKQRLVIINYARGHHNKSSNLDI